MKCFLMTLNYVNYSLYYENMEQFNSWQLKFVTRKYKYTKIEIANVLFLETFLMFLWHIFRSLNMFTWEGGISSQQKALIFFRFQASLDLCCFQCSLDLHRMYLSKLCLNKLIFHVMEDLPKVLYVYIYHIFFTRLYIFYNIIIYYNIFWMFIKTCFPNFASPTWYLLCTGFIFEITKESVI